MFDPWIVIVRVVVDRDPEATITSSTLTRLGSRKWSVGSVSGAAPGRGPAGVTAFDATETWPAPSALTALTVNVTAVPLVSPVTRRKGARVRGATRRQHLAPGKDGGSELHVRLRELVADHWSVAGSKSSAPLTKLVVPLLVAAPPADQHAPVRMGIDPERESRCGHRRARCEAVRGG
jgi:hypothetical protein